jgi:DinB superfamily
MRINWEIGMPVSDRNYLLHMMDETRSKFEVLLPQIDHHNNIYPGWTFSDILAHMIGWDDATIDALRAHMGRQPRSISDIRSLDEYNALSISSRKDLDDEHILNEWRLTRKNLRSIIEQLPEDKFVSPVIVPWGGKSTVTKLMGMLCDHEEEHMRDIHEWLENSDNPL